MKTTKNVLILIGMVLLPTLSIAQEGKYHTVRDFEAWSSATLSYKFNKKLKFGLNEQLRLKDNSSTIDVYFTQLSAKYNLTKKLSLGGGVRYIRENDNQGKVQGYESHFRWQTDLGYKCGIGRFKIKSRLRYQSKDELNVSEAEGDTVTNTFRLKLGAGYNIKNWKLDPEFSAEAFNRINSNESFDMLRLTIKTAYDLKRIGEFEAFYRIERDLVGSFPKTTHIVGLKYEYTIKRKKK